MPNDEIEIMRDVFCFLRDHNDPAANNSGRLVAFWERTAFDMGRLAEKWNGHSLAVVVLAGLYEYLGAKADAKTATAGLRLVVRRVPRRGLWLVVRRVPWRGL